MMNTFLNVFFQDPILIASAIILAITAAVFLWAFKSLRNINENENLYEIPEEDNIESSMQNENTGLHEARLQEITTQISEVNQRLSLIEKHIADNNNSEKTTTNLVTLENFNIALDAMNSKIDTITSILNKPHTENNEELHVIQNKLEGIHKLLILLTDSGNSDQK